MDLIKEETEMKVLKRVRRLSPEYNHYFHYSEVGVVVGTDWSISGTLDVKYTLVGMPFHHRASIHTPLGNLVQCC